MLSNTRTFHSCTILSQFGPLIFLLYFRCQVIHLYSVNLRMSRLGTCIPLDFAMGANIRGLITGEITRLPVACNTQTYFLNFFVFIIHNKSLHIKVNLQIVLIIFHGRGLTEEGVIRRGGFLSGASSKI